MISPMNDSISAKNRIPVDPSLQLQQSSYLKPKDTLTDEENKGKNPQGSLQAKAVQDVIGKFEPLKPAIQSAIKGLEVLQQGLRQIGQLASTAAGKPTPKPSVTSDLEQKIPLSSSGGELPASRSFADDELATNGTGQILPAQRANLSQILKTPGPVSAVKGTAKEDVQNKPAVSSKMDAGSTKAVNTSPINDPVSVKQSQTIKGILQRWGLAMGQNKSAANLSNTAKTKPFSVTPPVSVSAGTSAKTIKPAVKIPKTVIPSTPPPTQVLPGSMAPVTAINVNAPYQGSLAETEQNKAQVTKPLIVSTQGAPQGGPETRQTQTANILGKIRKAGVGNFVGQAQEALKNLQVLPLTPNARSNMPGAIKTDTQSEMVASNRVNEDNGQSSQVLSGLNNGNPGAGDQVASLIDQGYVTPSLNITANQNLSNNSQPGSTGVGAINLLDLVI
jgi:hypothetical protein